MAERDLLKQLARGSSPQSGTPRSSMSSAADIVAKARGASNTAEQWTPPPEPDSGGSLWGGLLKRVIDVVDTPRAVVMSGIKEGVDAVSGGEASFGDFTRQISERKTGAQYLADATDLPWWIRHPVGFVADVATDPLTYVTGGATAVARAGGRRAVGQMTAGSVVEKALEVGARKGGAAGREATEALSDLAKRGRNIDDLTVQASSSAAIKAASAKIGKANDDVAKGLAGVEGATSDAARKAAQQKLQMAVAERDKLVAFDPWSTTPASGEYAKLAAEQGWTTEVMKGVEELLKPGGKVARVGQDVADVLLRNKMGEARPLGLRFGVKVPFSDREFSALIPGVQGLWRPIAQARGPISRAATTSLGLRWSRRATEKFHDKTEAQLLNFVIRGDGLRGAGTEAAAGFTARAQLANQVRSQNSQIAAGVGRSADLARDAALGLAKKVDSADEASTDRLAQAVGSLREVYEQAQVRAPDSDALLSDMSEGLVKGTAMTEVLDLRNTDAVLDPKLVRPTYLGEDVETVQRWLTDTGRSIEDLASADLDIAFRAKWADELDQIEADVLGKNWRKEWKRNPAGPIAKFFNSATRKIQRAASVRTLENLGLGETLARHRLADTLSGLVGPYTQTVGVARSVEDFATRMRAETGPTRPLQDDADTAANFGALLESGTVDLGPGISSEDIIGLGGATRRAAQDAGGKVFRPSNDPAQAAGASLQRTVSDTPDAATAEAMATLIDADTARLTEMAAQDVGTVLADLDDLGKSFAPITSELLSSVSAGPAVRSLGGAVGPSIGRGVDEFAQQVALRSFKPAQANWQAHVNTFNALAGDMSEDVATEWRAALGAVEDELVSAAQLLDNALLGNDTLKVVEHSRAWKHREGYQLGSESRRLWNKIDATPGMAGMAAFMAPTRASGALLRQRSAEALPQLEAAASSAALVGDAALAYSRFTDAAEAYRLADQSEEIIASMGSGLPAETRGLFTTLMTDLGNTLAAEADIALHSPTGLRGTLTARLSDIGASISEQAAMGRSGAVVASLSRKPGERATQVTGSAAQEAALAEKTAADAIMSALTEAGWKPGKDLKARLSEAAASNDHVQINEALRPILARAFDHDVDELTAGLRKLAKDEPAKRALGAHMGVQMREHVADGLYTTGDLADIVRSIDNVTDPGPLEESIRHWLGIWKGMAISSPGFIVRNAYSAGYVNLAAGVDAATQTKVTRQYLRHAFKGERREKLALGGKADEEIEKFITAAQDAGGIMSMGVRSQETVDTTMRGFKASDDRRWVRLATAPVRALGAGIDWVQNTSAHVENAVRLSMAYDTFTKLDPAMAFEAKMGMARSRVAKHHFDYGDLSDMEQKIKLVIPFYTWMSRNWALQVDQYMRNPAMMVRMQRAFDTLDEEAPVNPFTPQYFDQAGFAAFSQKYFLNADLPYIAPIKDLEQNAGDTSLGPIPIPNLLTGGTRLAGEGNPLPGLVSTVGFGRDLEHGYQVEGVNRWVKGALYDLVPTAAKVGRIALPAKTSSALNGVMSAFGVPVKETTTASDLAGRRRFQSQVNKQEKEALAATPLGRQQSLVKEREAQAKAVWKELLAKQNVRRDLAFYQGRA